MARPQTTPQDSIRIDAEEFGRHVKAGGWRLGLLVARNVEPGNGEGGDRRSDHRYSRTSGPKVSGNEFARLSGVSRPKVMRYLDAWEAAAHLGHVPHAADLTPDREIDLDAEALPAWGDVYKTDPQNTNRAQYHARTVFADPEQRQRAVSQMDDAALAATAADIDRTLRGRRPDDGLTDADRTRRFKEADAFAKDMGAPIVDAFSRLEVVLSLEMALDSLRDMTALEPGAYDRISRLLDDLATEAEVKRAMAGIQ